MTTYDDPRRETPVSLIATFTSTKRGQTNGAQSSSGQFTEELNFVYEQPDISLSTGARYVEHDLIGGATVRQRMGEEAVKVDMTGLCTEDEANLIDRLHNAQYVELISYRTKDIDVSLFHVETADTEPFDSGGGFRVKDDRAETDDSEVGMVYDFSVSLTEL